MAAIPQPIRGCPVTEDRTVSLRKRNRSIESENSYRQISFASIASTPWSSRMRQPEHADCQLNETIAFEEENRPMQTPWSIRGGGPCSAWMTPLTPMSQRRRATPTALPSTPTLNTLRGTATRFRALAHWMTLVETVLSRQSRATSFDSLD